MQGEDKGRGEFDPAQVILAIAEAAEIISSQAGVGGMETAGSIVSYLAKHPDRIDGFLSGQESVLDWPIGWHAHGCLTWHAMNGKIVSPDFARRAQTIRKLERDRAPPSPVSDSSASTPEGERR